VKTLGKILLAIFILLAVAITFTIGWRPFIGPKARPTTNRQFERTPERLARGRYLVVGLVGATGRVTGPHLHWGARVGSEIFDPRALLDPRLFGSTP